MVTHFIWRCNILHKNHLRVDVIPNALAKQIVVQKRSFYSYWLKGLSQKPFYMWYSLVVHHIDGFNSSISTLHNCKDGKTNMLHIFGFFWRPKIVKISFQF